MGIIRNNDGNLIYYSSSEEEKELNKLFNKYKKFLINSLEC